MRSSHCNKPDRLISWFSKTNLVSLLLVLAFLFSAGPASAVVPDDGHVEPDSYLDALLKEHGFDEVLEQWPLGVPAGESFVPEDPCDSSWIEYDLCLELEDMVEWVTIYPDKAKVGDKLTYTGWVQNLMDIPLLVTLEYVVDTTQVCSITKFVTDSATPEPTPNTFLLAPEGLDYGVGEVGLSDTVAFQLNGVADAPGNCRISIMAVVSSVGMAVGSHTMTTKVSLPLGSTANMGVVTFNCALESISSVSSTQTVAAGQVDLKLEGLWAEPCGGSKASWLGVAGVVIDTIEDKEEVPIYAARVSVAASTDPEINTDKIHLDPGTHEFMVNAYIVKGGWKDHVVCLGAIFGILASALGITLATGGLAIGVGILLAIAALSMALGACDLTIENHDYKVTVKAEDPDQAVPGIPNPRDILAADFCLESGVELSNSCIPGGYIPNLDGIFTVDHCLGGGNELSNSCIPGFPDPGGFLEDLLEAELSN